VTWHSGHLAPRQVGEDALALHQLGIGPALDDSAVLAHVDPVSIDDGAEAVGEDNPGRGQAVEARSDDGLSSVVEGTGRLVKEDDPRPADDRAGDQQALAPPDPNPSSFDRNAWNCNGSPFDVFDLVS